jgi:Zn-finger in ubiquitin-hydrolases and other protein
MEKTEAFGADGKARRWICRECGNKNVWTCLKCLIPVCIDNQGAQSDLCHSNHILRHHRDVGLATLYDNIGNKQ